MRRVKDPIAFPCYVIRHTTFLILVPQHFRIIAVPMQNGECTVHLLLSFVRTVFGLHLKDMNVPLLLIKLLRNELRDSNRFSGLWKSYEKLIRREVHLSVRVAGITLSKPLLYDITHAYDLHPVVKVMCYK